MLSGERCESEFGKVFGKLIGPETLEKRRKVAKTGGNNAASTRFGVLQAARIIHQNGASLAARRFGAGFDQLRKCLAHHRNRHAPDIGFAQHRGFFARSKFEPKTLNQLLALAIISPGRSERREMLRGVRAAIFTGGDNLVGKLIQERANGYRRERAVGKFCGKKFKDERLRKAAQISLGSFSLLRGIVGHCAERGCARFPGWRFPWRSGWRGRRLPRKGHGPLPWGE